MMKVVRTVRSRGKDGDDLKILPIAIVYGIAITAMSFFTDPTISTLTSGTPSQNVDLAGMSFPRRLGVRFHNDYIKRYHLMGLQVKWEAYEDAKFENKLDKKFTHEDMITREGWAKYYFEGIFPNDVSYIKMQVRNQNTGTLVQEYFFKFEKSYQTSLDGRFYVKDPVLGTKIPKNGILTELKPVRKKSTGEVVYIPRKTTFKRDVVDFKNGNEKKKANEPAIIRTMCRYAEKPKMVFLVTPPHLMGYAKLILILIKQLVDLNFDQSYMTKETQKPLYKTRFMLDELGNLQSEGHGISGFETMLSIGLGQEQQFTLILQTLQQLKDVYGDSVDKIVQGNTSNIVFLKSTDDAMLDTLQKMSGTTHKSYRTSKSITKDVQKLNMQNDGKATYTIQTSEVPVITYNDMAFISERNSIIFRAGDAPIWNRNETILPMSWRMFQNTIVQPGKKYSLQTIPTLSTAMDFDIRQNQPDFVKMLDKRMAQSVQAMKAAKQYQEAYGYTDAEIAKLDIDAYSDELMELVNAALAEQDAIIKEQQESMAMQRNDGKGSEETEPEYGEDGIEEMTDEQFRQAAKYAKKDTGNKEDFGAIDASAIEANDEVVREANARQAVRDELNKKIYAGRMLSRGDFLRPDGSVSPKAHQFDKDIAKIYSSHAGAFANDYEHFRIIGDNLYSVDQQIAYIIKNTTHNAQADINALNEAAQDEDTRVFAEENIDPNVLNELGTYTITDAFYKYLTSLDTWDGIADDHFEDEMRRIAMDNAA